MSDYLDNLWNRLTNPKGNLGDFQHAARLYNSNVFRLAPKVKYLYHVVFNVEPSVSAKFGSFKNQHLNTVNLLVKSVDLPRFKVDVQTLNQYNRKKNVQTRLNYDPITITFHDDNIGITTQFWNLYYGYYFADNRYNNSILGISDLSSYLNNFLDRNLNLGNIFDFLNNGSDSLDASVPAAYGQNSYKGKELNSFNYGLDNGSTAPFFSSIQIFQMSRREYQCFTLVRPIVSSWQHDTMDQEDGSGIVQSRMTVNYEAVFYNKGLVSDGSLTGFGQEYYDKAPSPLSLAGGGTETIFGPGGVLDGITDILLGLPFGNKMSFLGNLGLGSTFATGLSSESLRLNDYQLNQSTYQNLATSEISVSGLANMNFPMNSGQGQNQSTLATSSEIQAVNNEPAATTQAFLESHPQAWTNLAKRTAFNEAIGGAANINDLNSQWSQLSSEQQSSFKQQTLDLVVSGDTSAVAQYSKIKQSYSS